jgi:predicted metal-binding membrane protein
MTEPGSTQSALDPAASRSLKKTVAAGSVAALLFAAVWAVALGSSGLQSALPGIHVGVFVGLTVRIVGRRADVRVILLGGWLSLWSCLFGTMGGFVMQEARSRGLNAGEAIVILASHGGEFLVKGAMTSQSVVAYILAAIIGALLSRRVSSAT